MTKDRGYEPVPLHCEDCNAVVAVLISGWVRTGKVTEDGEVNEDWRPAGAGDFHGLRCENCGGGSVWAFKKWVPLWLMNLAQGRFASRLFRRSWLMHKQLALPPLPELLGVPAEGYTEMDDLCLVDPKEA